MVEGYINQQNNRPARGAPDTTVFYGCCQRSDNKNNKWSRVERP